MKINLTSKYFLLLLSMVAGLAPIRVAADAKPATLFSDHMVIQRDMPIPVWGTANPGENVTVTFSGETQSAMADTNGRWMVQLGKEPANATPQVMTVAGKNTVAIRDILIGDIWLCSGQSNMEYRIAWDSDYNADDIARANDSSVRSFLVDYATDSAPATELHVSGYQFWQVESPKTAPDFSAVAFYYARFLREALGPAIPIGLITDDYGATPAEAWTSRDGLSKDPELKSMADKQLANMENYPGNLQAFTGQAGQWETKYGATDPGNTGEAQGWTLPDLNKPWPTTKVPTDFATLGMKGGGVVWFQKTFAVPAAFAGKDFTVKMNYSTDLYTVYLNGVKVNEDAGGAPPFINEARGFSVPGHLVKEGGNTLAVRVFSHYATGGLSIRAGDIPFSIGPNDDWQSHLEIANPALPAGAADEFPKAPFATKQYTSSYIFNAMINPILPMRIKGAIWYQGESNQDRGYQYRKLLPALIADWRSHWNEGDFPFYIVQLANFMATSPQPQHSSWAELRESQLLTATHVPNTGLAVAIDIGDANNIHPADKRDVGKRLALIALAKTYGRLGEYSGPLYLSSAVEGSSIRLKFCHAASGLIAKGGDPLRQFAIAGADKKFVWAEAHIDGASVVVGSPQVPNPVAVRYAWADNPEGCNLYNGAGLPASPFRTDDWPELTFDKH